MPSSTNEWEFQGQTVSWINAFLASHPIGLDSASQEVKNADGRRSDVTIWRDRAAAVAVLTMELKTPTTKVSDPKFQADAVRNVNAHRKRQHL